MTARLQTTACPPSYKFTGYERDSETGLDYAFARYYSPRLGRFLSTDPLGGSVGDLQSHNAYAYVENNPANFIDPIGLDGCEVTNGPVSVGTLIRCNVSAPAYPAEIHLTDVPGICTTIYRNGFLVSSSNGCSPNPVGGRAGVERVDGRSGGGGDNSSGFTLGIRAPGQTFNQCLVANAKNYSAGGVFALSTNTDVGTGFVGQLVAGNTFTSLYAGLAGSAEDAVGVAGTSSPDFLKAGMGTVTTFGRRTSNIVSLSLAGKGGLPSALSPATTAGAKSFLSSVSKALNLGLDASLKAAGDLGLFGAEIIGCSIHR